MSNLISVVVPVYNVAPYLEECVKSVLCQTYTNFELLLIDDGSTDGSGHLCDVYKEQDSRIQVIHQANGGLSQARNVGLRKAGGKYVYFLDSDDMIVPFALEALYTKCEIHQCECAFFDADLFGDYFNNPDYYHRKNLYSEVHAGPEVLEQLILNREYRSCVPMLFFRRDFLIQQHLQFKEGIYYEDELFTFQMFLLCSNAIYVPLKLYQRRIHANSIMTGNLRHVHFSSIVCVIQELQTFIEQQTNSDAKYIEVYMRTLAQSAYNKYYNLSRAEQRRSRELFTWLGEYCRQHAFFHSKKIQLQGHPGIYKSVGKFIRYMQVFLLPKFLKRTPRDAQNQHLFINPRDKKIWLIGTPTHGNLGDHAIAEAEKTVLKRLLPEYQLQEVLMTQYLEYRQYLRKVVKEEDIIIISGGGWLGTLWIHNEYIVREIIKTYKKNCIIIFPQTVFYEDSPTGVKELRISQKIYGKHKNLHFCLRDKKSYDFVVKNGLNQSLQRCYYVPDIALLFDWKNTDMQRKGILLCFRHDREVDMREEERWLIEKEILARGIDVHYTTTVYTKEIPLSERDTALKNKLTEYASSKLVITDRLHSMIFAAITGTSCIAFDNKTNKVRGVYDWLRKYKYIRVVDNVSDVLKLIPEFIKGEGYLYDNLEYFNRFEGMILSSKKD